MDNLNVTVRDYMNLTFIHFLPLIEKADSQETLDLHLEEMNYQLGWIKFQD